MKKLLLITTLLVSGGFVLAQNANYAPSGPSPLGPGDEGWTGQTITDGPAPSDAGGLTQAEIEKPLSDQWTTYAGDLSGKRYSNLKLVNKDTVKYLSLKWITPLVQGCGPDGTGQVNTGAGAAAAGGG